MSDITFAFPPQQPSTPIRTPIRTPVESSDAFFREWKRVQRLLKEIELGAVLHFSNFAMAKTIECSEKMQYICTIATEDASFASPEDLNTVRDEIATVEDTIMTALPSPGDRVIARGLQEPDSETLVESLASLDAISETDIPLTTADVSSVLISLEEIEGLMGPVDGALRKIRNRARRDKKKKHNTPEDIAEHDYCRKILAGSTIAVGCMHELLLSHPEVLENDNSGGRITKVFVALFDLVVGSLGRKEGSKRVPLGSSLKSLSMEAQGVAVEAMQFVTDAEISKEWVPTLGCFIVGDKHGYHRSEVFDSSINELIVSTEKPSVEDALMVHPVAAATDIATISTVSFYPRGIVTWGM